MLKEASGRKEESWRLEHSFNLISTEPIDAVIAAEALLAPDVPPSPVDVHWKLWQGDGKQVR